MYNIYNIKRQTENKVMEFFYLIKNQKAFGPFYNEL